MKQEKFRYFVHQLAGAFDVCREQMLDISEDEKRQHEIGRLKGMSAALRLFKGCGALNPDQVEQTEDVINCINELLDSNDKSLKLAHITESISHVAEVKRVFVVHTAGRTWGKADNIIDALKNASARKSEKVIIQVILDAVPDEVSVDDFGSIVYPGHARRIQVYKGILSKV